MKDWLRFDYKPALFLMGAAPLSLTPVIVAPPEDCIAEAAEEESARATTSDTKEGSEDEISQETGQAVSSFESSV